MKTKVRYSIITALMWLLAIKGTIAVISDNNSAHYNNLPMWGVYTLLVAFLIMTIIATIRTIQKFRNEKEVK